MTKKKQASAQVQMLPMSAVEINAGQLEGLPANPREIRDEKFEKLKANIQKYPELLEYRSLMVYPMPNGKHIIIGGNMRYRAMQELGYTEVPCVIIPAETPVERLGAYTILDNNGFGKWDWDLLANEWSDWNMEDLGLDWDFAGFGEVKKDINDRSDWKKGESNDEYDKFVDKFKPEIKLTTDDCYTPPVVFESVVSWVKEEYGIDEKTEIIRPFYPGGDYEHHNYPKGCVVIDNPPFSIMAQIMDFYQERGIRFFLFCDMRTGGTTAIRRDGVTFIAAYSAVTYENGAIVSTAFVTNMTPELAIRTAPELKRRVAEAQEKEKEKEKEKENGQKKILHHENTVVIARLMAISGVDYELKRDDIVTFNHCSKTVKGIYGAFGLVGELKAAELKAAELKAAELKAAEKKAAELKAAELKAAELKAAERVELEAMDYEIIEQLNNKNKQLCQQTSVRLS